MPTQATAQPEHCPVFSGGGAALSLDRKAAVAKELRRDVLPLLGDTVRPTIAATFDMRDAAHAHAAMEENAHIGKIMLTVEHD